MVSSFGALPAASGIVVRSHDATTECEFDLVRKRPDHGSGLRPWIPNNCCFTDTPLNPICLTRAPPCEPGWRTPQIGPFADLRGRPHERALIPTLAAHNA